jgi:NAD(P)-dependent dehydrogenase (short-subunit alcohol dehydrogenase family)
VGSRTVLVTGANRGIGRAIASGLAAEGFDLILACRNIEAAQAACDELGRGGARGRLEASELDLSRFDSILGLAGALEAEGRTIDILVNNAGVLPDRFILSPEGFELAMAVNYLGPVLLTRRLLPRLARGSGKVINTCSSAFRVGHLVEEFAPAPDGPYHPIQAYADSKLALLMFTEELAARVGDQGIRVNAVDPGVTNTKMITLHRWFDPLTDALFRPLIQGNEGGAKPCLAIARATDGEFESGGYYRNRRRILVPPRARSADRRRELWDRTEEALAHVLT